MRLKILVHPAAERGYWAEVPGFPGCVSDGETLDEVRANIREAFEGVFDVLQERHEVHPDDQTPEDRLEVIEL
jgi:predicted RNase H-like HicB family nuclease